MLKEQFLTACHEELKMFLRERGPEIDSLEKMARVAEQYVDAHSCSVSSKTKHRDSNSQVKFSGQEWSNPRGQGVQRNPGANTEDRKPIVCFLCNKVGHYARECRQVQQAKHKAAGIRPWQGWNKGSGQEGGRSDEQEWRDKAGFAAACQTAGGSLAAVQSCTVDGRLRLANGQTVPIVTGACDRYRKLPTENNMPISSGYVEGQTVKVLRDTGCSTAAIRAKLVRPTQ